MCDIEVKDSQGTKMKQNLKTWHAPEMTTLDVDKTLSAGWLDHTEGSFVSGIPGKFGQIVDHIGNHLGTPGGS